MLVDRESISKSTPKGWDRHPHLFKLLIPNIVLVFHFSQTTQNPVVVRNIWTVFFLSRGLAIWIGYERPLNIKSRIPANIEPAKNPFPRILLSIIARGTDWKRLHPLATACGEVLPGSKPLCLFWLRHIVNIVREYLEEGDSAVIARKLFLKLDLERSHFVQEPWGRREDQSDMVLFSPSFRFLPRLSNQKTYMYYDS